MKGDSSNWAGNVPDMKMKQTEYGEIPTHFRLEPLRDLCTREGGIQTGPFGSQLHQRDYVADGTPIITVEHLGENHIIQEDIPQVSDSDRNRLARYLLREGDIVFSRVGSVDRRAIVSRSEDGWLFSGRCLRVRPDPTRVDCQYLSHFFGLEAFREYIRSIAVGATMPSLNTRILSDVPIVLPPLPEQRSIAHILSTLDDKIELNRRMNQTLEAMASSIFQDWFADFGPVRAKLEGQEPYLPPELWDLFPDNLADSELGEIPEGWEVKPLEQFVDLNPREPLKKGTLAPYLDMGALPTTGSTTDPPVLRDFTSGTRFRNGDALLARITPCLENGKTGFVQSIPEGVAGWGSTEFIVMRSIPPVPSEFAYLLARDSGFRSHAIQSMTGTSGRQRVQTEALASYSLPCPPVDYWEAFGSVAKETFERVKSNRDEIATLTAQRDLLLPKLVSGQWNIGDF